MGMFSTLLEKLGFKKPSVTEAPSSSKYTGNIPAPNKPPQMPPPLSGKPPLGKPPHGMAPGQMPPPPPGTPPMRKAMEMVDVVGKLDGLAKASKEKLDWKVSIVDLLKLVGMESSLEARKELAAELGCPADQMGGDHSKMNIWLHKTVIKKIAENGGNVPPALLD